MTPQADPIPVGAAAPRVARYTVSVVLTRPIDVDEDVDAYTSVRARAALERDIVRALRPLEGDADCEVMTTEILGEE